LSSPDEEPDPWEISLNSLGNINMEHIVFSKLLIIRLCSLT
jgi:hypothetical protein